MVRAYEPAAHPPIGRTVGAVGFLELAGLVRLGERVGRSRLAGSLS